MRSRIVAPGVNGKAAGGADGARQPFGRASRRSASLTRTQTACKCHEDEEEDKSGRRTGNGKPLRQNPGAVLQRLGPGRPLDGAVRGRMERAFGTDFRGVRVHTDAQAGALASELGANAFTVDQHVAFASGRYRPGTRLGDALLAHELAHTIQQRGGGELDANSGGGLNSAVEKDANSSTQRALRSLWTGRSSVSQEDALPSLRTGTRLSLSGCGSSNPGACTLSGRFTSIPSGNLTPTWSASANKFGAPFSMEASFAASGDGCDCHWGEYRQYVKGYFKVNGRALTHQLYERALDSTYQEDHWKEGGTWYHYGYRNQQFATSKFDNPDQATGCDFHGQDFPGVRGASGASLEVNLGFKGELIDTRNPSTPLASQEWTVNGTGTQP